MIPDIPILLTAFNRPDLFRKNVNALVSYGVKKLYIAVDGPRSGYSEDRAGCEAVVGIVEQARLDGIQIELLRRSENLGCQLAMAGAISWFFGQVDCGIVIEDDCLADPAFIRFADELLKRYKDNASVMHISGSNFLDGKHAGKHSYYFSAVPHIWGWATWKRAWEQYDADIAPDIVDRLDGYFDQKHDRERFRREFEHTAAGKLDSWGYRWIYSVWKNKGFCITPEVNLVTNIGFGEKATHTTREKSSLSALSLGQMNFPLSHPNSLEINKKADNALYKKHYRPKRTLKSFMYTHVFSIIKSKMPKTYEKLKSLW